MTAGEDTPTQEQHNNLHLELTKHSEKYDELQAESESIASAIQGGEEDEAGKDEGPSDLEKAPTQASHGSHGLATRITTAADWYVLSQCINV